MRTTYWRRGRRPRHLRQKKEAAAAPPPSESKWRELRPRTPFSDPFQRSGATVANIPHFGDWSSQAVNQQKGDGSSVGSTAKVRLDARAPMRREPAASFGASREPLRWLRSPLSAAGDASMALRLWPSEPEIGDDLALFLCRHGCFAEVAKDGAVIVESCRTSFMRSRRVWNSASTSVSGRLFTASVSESISSPRPSARAAGRRQRVGASIGERRPLSRAVVTS